MSFIVRIISCKRIRGGLEERCRRQKSEEALSRSSAEPSLRPPVEDLFSLLSSSQGPEPSLFSFLFLLVLNSFFFP